MHHPHVHAVVAGGGLSPDGSRWVRCKKSKKSKKEFFVHVSVLSEVFRGKFIAHLKQAFASGQISFPGQLKSYANPSAFESLLDQAVRHDWVVYAKRPFSSPNCVLKYLARYTHRVAISNPRLIDIEDGCVRFQYKDYADANQTKVLKLSTEEFMRRFLMHTLPSGFVRIRYYGFLANRCRAQQLERCRQLLGVPVGEACTSQDTLPAPEGTEPAAERRTCPSCKTGVLQLVATFLSNLPQRVRAPHFMRTAQLACHNDSS